MSVQYTERVDAVIYGSPACYFTPRDWLQLALAALDQVGSSRDIDQAIKRIQDELNSLEAT